MNLRLLKLFDITLWILGVIMLMLGTITETFGNLCLGILLCFLSFALTDFRLSERIKALKEGKPKK